MFFTLLILSCFIFKFSTNERTKEKKVIMAIFAHPDDEAVSNVSPLLTKYANEGYTVYLVIATKGELGVAKHANIPPGDTLAVAKGK